MKRTFLSLFVGIVLIFSLVGAVSALDDLASVKEAGVLKFGASSDYIPFVFMDGTTLDGMDVALATEIAKRIGVKLEPVDMAFDGLIDSVMIGQVDLIGGALSVTDARKEKIDFSNPYYAAMGIVVGRSDFTLGDGDREVQIAKIRLGVQAGTSFDQWVKSNLLMGGNITSKNVFTFSKEADMMKALKNNVVDCALIDEDVYDSEYKTSGTYKVLDANVAKESYAFAAAKGSTLIPAVNQALNDMFSDGTAQKIANKYFSMDYTDKVEASITRPAQTEPLITKPETSAAAPTAVPSAASAIVPQPANCMNGMQFVNDVTVVDGTILASNSQFEKKWNIKNTGTCYWEPTYTFNYVKGGLFGSDSIAIRRAVAPGEIYEMAIPITAPNYDGDFVSYWQMRSDSGQNFGQTIWCNFIVSGASANLNPGAPAAQGGGPMITQWQPSIYKGAEGVCPIVYWTVTNAYQVEFYINNQFVQKTTDKKGSTYICPPKAAGTYNYGIRAVGNSAISDAFQFVNTGGDNGAGKNVPAPAVHHSPYPVITGNVIPVVVNTGN